MTTERVMVEIPAGALVVQAPPPELLTQRNVESVCGMSPRQYLDSLRSFQRAGGRVTKLGKLRVVSRVEYIAALRAGQLAGNASAQLEGVAARIGLVEV